jgi:putative oxidoreductase
MAATLAIWSPRILSILRMVTALLLIQHGTARVFDFPHWERTGGGSLPPTLLVVASCFELIGGGLAALGLFSRPVCFLLSGFTAGAYFIAHAGRSFFPMLNGGESAVMFSFAFLYLTFAGPGPWSLDAVIRSRSSQT